MEGKDKIMGSRIIFGLIGIFTFIIFVYSSLKDFTGSLLLATFFFFISIICILGSMGVFD